MIGVLVLVMIGLFVARNVLIRSASDEPGGARPARKRVMLITVGTGGMSGVYYKVGGAIQQVLNARKGAYGLNVSYQASRGSVYNINAVLSGDIDVGVCQADRQFQAYQGEGEWQATGARKELRSICSLYPEAVTLVASDKSGIRTVSDLKGKRVNLGAPGSGDRGNALAVLKALGIDPEKDLHGEGIKAVESAKLLQDGRLDAFFYTVGHPAAAIIEATAGRRPVRIVPITGVDQMLASSPYYAKTTIAMKLYPKAANQEDVPTFGMLTTLVVSEKASEDMVYSLTKALFENLDEFRSCNPAFANLKAENMARDGLSAPIHSGALRYYREAGLLQQ
ncbi:MAG: TAXI family TRAP transporter solute-binding subunit [Lentisphaeria bacterium]|nr:TAXI family TRAP transporter solute-binding subunit [Lentisphaeria bacterium]